MLPSVRLPIVVFHVRREGTLGGLFVTLASPPETGDGLPLPGVGSQDTRTTVRPERVSSFELATAPERGLARGLPRGLVVEVRTVGTVTPSLHPYGLT